jgi:glycosyltransferase involved in cell wall biosynthesis
MKIVFISSFPPSKEGVGKYTQRLMKDLNAFDIETHAITFCDKKCIDDKNIHRVISSSYGGIKKTWETLRDIGPDVIHVQFAIPIFRLYSFILWPILYYYKRYYNTLIFSTLHEPKREVIYLGIFGRLFYSYICKICDEINILTSGSRDFLAKKCNIPVSKMQVISHGVFVFKNKEDHSKILRNKFNILDQQKIILFFGYIHIDKGIEYLIEAFAKFIQDTQNKNYILVLAGEVRPRVGIFKIFQKIDEMYEQKIRKLINKYELSKKVIFSGYVEEDDMYSMFKLGDVVVLPYSKAEQSGVLNVALTCDIPIIASDLGGFHDVLSESGILVRPKDSDAIYIALKEILCEKNDLFKESLFDKYHEFGRKNNSYAIAEKQIERYRLKLNS